MIRTATKQDLDSVMLLVEDAKSVMQQDNNNQWDEHYPLSEHFVDDINNESLFVLESNDKIYGFIVVNQNQSEWYDKIEWPINRTNAYVIHRLASSPDYKGGATELFDFAVNLAEDHGVHMLITDTFALNYRAQSLFRKFGFTKVGGAEMDYHPFNKGKPFYAYYKKLEE
jgi:GNAT superfamily N-acetyltransferase